MAAGDEGGHVEGGAVYFVYADHLGTPQRVTDAAAAVVWDADYRPFGKATVTGALTFNLRFPGQYYDAETGLHYNYFRDYDTATGRYIQSDPIGLQGGWNTYAYVGGRPVMRVDPEGLAATCTTVFSFTLNLPGVHIVDKTQPALTKWGLFLRRSDDTHAFWSALCGAVRFWYQTVTYEKRALAVRAGYCVDCNNFYWWDDTQTVVTDRWEAKETISKETKFDSVWSNSGAQFSVDMACLEWLNNLNVKRLKR